MPLLAASDLHKTYVTGEARVTALAGVSFTVERGDFVALMGPSGCGKSTLLHLCGAMDRPTSGTLRLEDSSAKAERAADEPTGNLDSENGANVLALLSELNREMHVTVLLATHAADVAAAANRTLKMKDGKFS